MKPTRVRELLGLFAVAAVATWIVVRVAYGSLPPISVLAASSLFPVAVLVVVLAFVIRNRVRNRRVGDGPNQLHPITVARSVALAKASALVGSAAAGVWLGFLVHVVPQRATLRAAAADTPGGIVGLIAGLVLAAAALWLEHCCRTPDDEMDNPAT